MAVALHPPKKKIKKNKIKKYRNKIKFKKRIKELLIRFTQNADALIVLLQCEVK
jgi:hypothetical protein